MATIKLPLGKLSPEKKIELATTIHFAMSGNSHYPEPSPPLDSLISTVEELNQAITHTTQVRQQSIFDEPALLSPEEVIAKSVRIHKQSKIATACQEDFEDKLDAILAQLASYVEKASGGDNSKILSAGMC
ncbi:MAG: hypothetical protein WCL19_11460 [Verrucomicrobiota bacterium]